MSYLDVYHNWLTWVDDETRDELTSLRNLKEIEDRFYRDLAFGTGGLRGIMGAGSNRMNKYTIRKATKGLVDFLHEEYADKVRQGVVIAYDSRMNSAEFALETAHVLCSYGIPVKLFQELEPTPLLSFAVKYLHAIAGIVITASHNPKEYNGYKVYDQYGDQIVPRIANVLIQYVNAVANIADIHVDGNEDLLSYVGEDIVEAFVSAVHTQSVLHGDVFPLKIVYTPLHGAGNKPIRRVLDKAGFTDVSIVKEQELPDGKFSTVKSPNPEEHSALAMGLELGKHIKADIVIGTDPDSDRIGVGVNTGNQFSLLTGNQIGALLVHFVLTMRANMLTPASTLIKTVVTGELGADIARANGVQVVETLTGFKYIGEKITQYMHDPGHEFVMGYEESYGYLVGTHAQDKDAVVTAMLICEMASYYKKQGKTLIMVLNTLYAEYGYYCDALSSYTLKGKDGAEQIQYMMQTLRNEKSIDLLPDIGELVDYDQGVNGLPCENMVKFVLKDKSWIAVRPSGTEPKIKIYYSIKDTSCDHAIQRLKNYQVILKSKLNL